MKVVECTLIRSYTEIYFKKVHVENIFSLSTANYSPMSFGSAILIEMEMPMKNVHQCRGHDGHYHRVNVLVLLSQNCSITRYDFFEIFKDITWTKKSHCLKS